MIWAWLVNGTASSFEYTWKDTNGRYVIQSRIDPGVALSHSYAKIA